MSRAVIVLIILMSGWLASCGGQSVSPPSDDPKINGIVSYIVQAVNKEDRLAHHLGLATGATDNIIVADSTAALSFLSFAPEITTIQSCRLGDITGEVMWDSLAARHHDIVSKREALPYSPKPVAGTVGLVVYLSERLGNMRRADVVRSDSTVHSTSNDAPQHVLQWLFCLGADDEVLEARVSPIVKASASGV